MQKAGIGLSNSRSNFELSRCAELAEEHGLAFWLHEGYHSRGSTVLMASLASKTKTIQLGLGVLSPIIRHPYTIAMDVGALDEATGGRVVLGLGAAVSGAMRQNLDVRAIAPLKRMRESVAALRALLSGERVYRSEFFDAPPEGVRLGFRPARERLPIYVGAMGPKMLELAGEIGDGVLLNYGCSVDYIRFALEHVRVGMKRRKLKEEPVVCAFVLTSVAEERDKAIAGARHALPSYLARSYPIALEYSGIPSAELDEVLRLFRKSKVEEAASAVSDAMLEKMVVCGNPQECAQQMKNYYDVGVESFIAENLTQSDPVRMTELMGKSVVPALTSE